MCVKPDKCPQGILLKQVLFFFFFFFLNGSMRMSAPLKHWWRYNSAALIGRAPGGGVRWGGVDAARVARQLSVHVFLSFYAVRCLQIRL